MGATSEHSSVTWNPPTLPCNAPFTIEQRAWINGFIAARCTPMGREESRRASGEGVLKPRTALKVLFGSQTGNAEGLSRKFAKDAKLSVYSVEVKSLNEFDPISGGELGLILIVTSTWGDGDLPDNAVEFWRRLSVLKGAVLNGWRYGVLALGDRNYPEFCGAGRKLDGRLTELGAQRICVMGECDTDFDKPANVWFESYCQSLSSSSSQSSLKTETEIAHTPPGLNNSDSKPNLTNQAKVIPRIGRDNPYRARILANNKLNQSGSQKDTRHIELDIDPEAVNYEAGDAVGIFPKNNPVLVSEILCALGLSGDEAVNLGNGKELRLEDALVSYYNITLVGPTLIELIARSDESSQLNELIRGGGNGELTEWLKGRDLLDCLLSSPKVRLKADELLSSLQPLRPRLYSISSSPKLHPNRIHITLGVVRYQEHGRVRQGVCSTYLAERLNLGDSVSLYIQSSPKFRLPKNPDIPIIMIGPGTGIAPFRAFLQEREAVSARGSNWLFFGDQTSQFDFLYRNELEGWLNNGLITRMDLAFSRDQSGKVYVQDRIEQNSLEVWKWVEGGAHIYVCGDAKRMAKDVENALLGVIESHGKCDAQTASSYLVKLKESGRYQRDVY